MSASVQQQPAAADAATADVDQLPEWCTDDDVGRCARMSPRRIRKEVRIGRLRAAVIDGRGTLRIHRSWIRIWMERLADESPFATQPGSNDLADERPLAKPSDGSQSKVRDFKRTAAADCNEDGQR